MKEGQGQGVILKRSERGGRGIAEGAHQWLDQPSAAPRRLAAAAAEAGALAAEASVKISTESEVSDVGPKPAMWYLCEIEESGREMRGWVRVGKRNAAERGARPSEQGRITKK